MKDPVARETAPRCGSEIRLTYEDYLRVPAGLRYELVEGELRMPPSPSTFHQRVSKRLLRALMEAHEDKGRGEVFDAPCDVVLSEHNVVQPDLFFIFKERLGIVDKANVLGVPDIVFEILSESTDQWDRVTKRRLYAKYGVKEYWIIDLQARTIEVASHSGTDFTTAGVYPEGAIARSILVPDLSVDACSLFKE